MRATRRECKVYFASGGDPPQKRMPASRPEFRERGQRGEKGVGWSMAVRKTSPCRKPWKLFGSYCQQDVRTLAGILCIARQACKLGGGKSPKASGSAVHCSRLDRYSSAAGFVPSSSARPFFGFFSFTPEDARRDEESRTERGVVFRRLSPTLRMRVVVKEVQ